MWPLPPLPVKPSVNVPLFLKAFRVRLDLGSEYDNMSSFMAQVGAWSTVTQGRSATLRPQKDPQVRVWRMGGAEGVWHGKWENQKGNSCNCPVKRLQGSWHGIGKRHRMEQYPGNGIHRLMLLTGGEDVRTKEASWAEKARRQNFPTEKGHNMGQMRNSLTRDWVISHYQWDIQVSTCSRLLGIQTGTRDSHHPLSPGLLSWPPHGSTAFAFDLFWHLHSLVEQPVWYQNISQKIAPSVQSLERVPITLSFSHRICLGPTRPRSFDLLLSTISATLPPHGSFPGPLADTRGVGVDFPLEGKEVESSSESILGIIKLTREEGPGTTAGNGVGLGGCCGINPSFC